MLRQFALAVHPAIHILFLFSRPHESEVTEHSIAEAYLLTEKRSDRQYDVEFRDVSFRYPGSDIWALRHVNMRFKVGKRLAIVGENGSGKTTFIKLLCRLYDPQESRSYSMLSFSPARRTFCCGRWWA